ncbi:UNVERIFIED_CONTAM: hypothetical protein FKN15_011814 [Acipenser sinensis]
MPADMMEKSSCSPVAATPASMNTTPDKPKTASEHRKSSKPIMEKRRRARINESLGQLKTLILDALKKDSSRHSKLEKADILEMTVKHLRNLQRAQMTATATARVKNIGRTPRSAAAVVVHFVGYCQHKMPADMEKTSCSPVAATPASMNTTPDKPKTASEHRKSSKPIMEKRRRARINESLGQLKTLILDALKKDSSRHSKLEKADILEMTVKHLRNLQRAQMTAALNTDPTVLGKYRAGTDPTVLGKYRAGFSECMNEVTRFLSTCEGVNTEVRTRLLGHLASCMSQINAMNYPTQPQIPAGHPHPAFGQIPGASPQTNVLPLNGMPCKAGSALSAPTDATKMYGGFQLVPATNFAVL